MSIATLTPTRQSGWSLIKIYQRGLRILAPEVLMPGILHDLLTRALGDDGSVLDAWRRLGILIPVSPGTMIPDVDSLVTRALGVCSCRPEEQVRIVRRYTEANELLAKNLIRLASSGALTRELTDVLAAVGMFIFHRHGISGISSLSSKAFSENLSGNMLRSDDRMTPACQSIEYSAPGPATSQCLSRFFAALIEPKLVPHLIPETTGWAPTEQRARPLGVAPLASLQ